MSIIDTALSRFGYVKADDPRRAQFLAAQVGWQGSFPVADPDPSMYGYQAELMQRLSWVYSAVTRVAETFASLGNYRVMRWEGETKAPIINHEFEQLLRHPNPYQFDSRFEFYEALAGFLKLSGNAYIYANALSPQLPPAELWILRSDRVYVVPDKEKLVRGYIYQIEGREVPFDADEIVHIKTFHPLNDWYGLSAIESLAMAAESDFKQAEWNKKFFSENNAKPQGALQYADMINDSDWLKMKEDMKREHGGTERRMLMLRGAGKGGVQFLQMGFTQKDMEFLGGRQFNKEEIWSTLAPGLLQMMDKNATEANAIAGERTFREYCIWTLMQRVGEKLSARLLPRYGENLVGEFEDIRYRDRNLEMAEQESYAKTHTVAEVRKKYYGDDPLGDERDNLLPAQISAGAAPQSAVSEGMPPALQNANANATNNAAPNQPTNEPTNTPMDASGDAANAQDAETAAAKAEGHWITLDNGQHILIGDDGGTESPSRAYFDRSSSDERKALKKYKGEDYEYINNYLRESGELAADENYDYEGTVEKIDKAIDSVKLERDTTVWRGMSSDWLDEEDMTGTEFTDAGYWSTTTNKKTADQFDRGMVVQLELKKGEHAFFLDVAGGNQEGEIILKRGQKYRIIDDNYPNEPRRLKLEVVH